MKKIILLICVLFSLNGMAQGPWDFKTSQSLDVWAAGTQTLSAAIVTDGVEITWEAAKTPKLATTGANLDVTNGIMAITLMNNSTEPIAFRAKFPKSSGSGNKFYRGSSWDVVPTGVSTPTTYYFDLGGESEWTGHGATALNTFELQIGDTGASNTTITARDDASTSGNTIIIEKIEFLDAIPATPGTITSAAAGDWDAGATWVGGVVPASVNDVVVNHAVRVKQNVTAEMASLTIGGSPGQLRIDNESIVKVTGAVDITRTQDGIALYAQSGPLGSFTYGSITQNQRVFIRPRVPANNKWSLISSPLKESRVNEIIELNSSNVVISTANPTNIGFASYNDANAAGSRYEYYQTTNSPHANSEQLVQGKGYSILINNVGDTSKPDHDQRGLLVDTFPIDIAITDGGNGFNLLGNPLTGYLNVNDAADATNNILRVNGANGTDILAEDTIWLWDSVNESWVTHNLGSTSYKMPGVQGFFVKSKAGGGTFTFTKAMQSDAGNTFMRSSNNSFVVDLSIANADLSRKTSIIYRENTSISFDNGYDSSMFGGYSSGLAVYTNLVEGDLGKKLAIQSLPNENFESMVIPVGVIAEANSEITFSAEALNIPTGYKVFLEDRVNNTFTRLDEVATEYTATVSETSTEGRFYLHTRTSVLSVDSALLNSVSIYSSDASTLRIVGLSQGNTSMQLFSIEGKQVMSSNFNAEGVKELSLPKLSKGVYIVQLETELGKLNRKIVLE